MSETNIKSQNIWQRCKSKLESFFNNPIAVGKLSFALIILMTVVEIYSTVTRYYAHLR
jgi:hypothetical protein